MLNRLRAGPRLVLLMAVQMLILIAAGAVAVIGLQAAAFNTVRLDQNLNEQIALSQMSEALRTEVLATVSDAVRQRITWDQAQMDLAAARNVMISLWDEYQSDKTAQEITALRDSLAKHHEALMFAFSDLERMVAEQDQTKLASYQEVQLKNLADPFIAELNERIAQQQLQSDSLFQHAASDHRTYIFAALAVIALGLMISGALGAFVYRSIAGSLKILAATIRKHAGGDDAARTGLSGADELSTLGMAFDHLLNERVARLDHARQDNARLNDAVMLLLQAIAQLSRRDLTVKIPVNEDATGPVADALNQFTDETAQVLIDMRHIAERVAKAAVMVRTQSDLVLAAAATEQSEIDETVRLLAQASATFNPSTGQAQANDPGAAEETIDTLLTALQAIANTVDGFNALHSTLHSAGEHLQRLGERVQTLDQTTHSINNLAERAHILALNAGMHAAAAGEAGRGFAGVASEVQRLAEHTRAAAQQMAILAGNLQSETVDTVLTINTAVTQAATGSGCAEQAAEHMLYIQDHTRQRDDAVRKIIQEPSGQTLTQLQERALALKTSTRNMREQIQEHIQHTQRLAQYSKVMLSAVQVFTLPDDAQEAASMESGATPVPLKMRAS